MELFGDGAISVPASVPSPAGKAAVPDCFPGSLSINSVHEPGRVPERSTPLRGVITDWGGVMTNPILETVKAWLDADGIDHSSYRTVMGRWVRAYGDAGDGSPIHALERGECTTEEFERLLAAEIVRLDGDPVAPDGLLAKMFAGTVLSEPMQSLMRELRSAGLRTALLSNSWGLADYPREVFPGLFDAVVLSAEVGMRKPEEQIFLHAAQLLGLRPQECVFIDDIEVNVTAAEAIGMVGVLHTDPADSAARVRDLAGLDQGVRKA
jgi:putative hydrolase of the HAD superfamily